MDLERDLECRVFDRMSNQDFWSMKSRLVDFIRTRFTTNFNDFVESDLAIMLMELYAFLADTQSFKTDQIANEIFIDTVTEIENAFRLVNISLPGCWVEGL